MGILHIKVRRNLIINLFIILEENSYKAKNLYLIKIIRKDAFEDDDEGGTKISGAATVGSAINWT